MTLIECAEFSEQLHAQGWRGGWAHAMSKLTREDHAFVHHFFAEWSSPNCSFLGFQGTDHAVISLLFCAAMKGEIK